MDYCKLFILFSVASTSFAQNDYCQEGTYGNNCELKCSDQCRPLQTFPCNRKTGKCSEGCTNGYYGDQCDQQCYCPSGICFQESGECIGTGTTTVSTTKNTTEKIISTTAQPVCDGVEAGWRTSAIILIVFIILLVCGVVMRCFCLGLKKKKIALPGFLDTCQTRFSKAADSDVPGDEEKGSDTAETHLIQENAGEEATGGQDKTTKHGDQSEETSQEFKQSQQVEELKQQIKQLQEENKRLEGALSRYEYRENDIHSVMGLKQNKTNSTYYLMKKDSTWLYCPHLTFDKETVNVKVAQIDDNMVLWNTQDKNPQNMGRRFQNFQGTTCSEPLEKAGYYQYFEAKFYISLHQRFGEGIISQFGLCSDKELNTPFIATKKPCVVVEVASCKEHEKICLLFINNGKTTHLKELINNMAGSSYQVHIGIRLRKDLKRIHIFNFSEESSLPGKDSSKPRINSSVPGIDIDIGEQIWPMFGVCAQNEATVSVQLITGRGIDMWMAKKEMIKSDHM